MELLDITCFSSSNKCFFNSSNLCKCSTLVGVSNSVNLVYNFNINYNKLINIKTKYKNINIIKYNIFFFIYKMKNIGLVKMMCLVFNICNYV